MKTQKVMLRLAAVSVLAAAAAALAIVGCGNSGNPMPPQPDASHHDVSNGTDSGTDTSKPDGEHPDGKSPTDGGSDAPDVSLPDVTLDTGSCKSDSSACNSCYTDAQAILDPFNACSTYTKNCLPFTGSVPSHPSL